MQLQPICYHPHTSCHIKGTNPTWPQLPASRNTQVGGRQQHLTAHSEFLWSMFPVVVVLLLFLGSFHTLTGMPHQPENPVSYLHGIQGFSSNTCYKIQGFLQFFTKCHSCQCIFHKTAYVYPRCLGTKTHNYTISSQCPYVPSQFNHPSVDGSQYYVTNNSPTYTRGATRIAT